MLCQTVLMLTLFFLSDNFPNIVLWRAMNKSRVRGCSMLCTTVIWEQNHLLFCYFNCYSTHYPSPEMWERAKTFLRGSQTLHRFSFQWPIGLHRNTSQWHNTIIAILLACFITLNRVFFVTHIIFHQLNNHCNPASAVILHAKRYH